MALTKIGTDGFKDDSVTTDKLANAINTERTANTAKVSLEADSVTGAKIADDAVGAEHIEQLDADLSFADNAKAKFGAGNDLEIYHDGGGSIIKDSGTGDLRIGGDGDLLIMNAALDETKAKFSSNGAVELYHDNSKKLETTSTGVSVTGDLSFADSAKAKFGTGSDFTIFHDGSNTYLTEEGDGTGQVYLRANSIELLNNSNETYAKFLTDGAVELYHDNVKKFETTSYGTRTTGYHTQSTAIGFQGDAADWTSSEPNMHNMSLQWDSGDLVNSTGVFTCPVAGKYLCSASVQAHRTNNSSGASSTFYNVLWQKNSSNYHIEMVGTIATDASAQGINDANGNHESVTATVIMDCAANDTIRAHSNHGYRHNTQNIISVYFLG